MIDFVGAARRVAVCALLGTAVVGCAAVDEVDREIYRESCDNLDIQRGTDAYSACMLQQQRLDVEEMEGMLNRNAGY